MKLLPPVYCIHAWIKANNKLEKIRKEKQSYLLNKLNKLTATIDLSGISIWWRHQKFRTTFRKQFLSRGVGNDLSSEIICFMERSSRPDVLCQKGVLRHFAKFTGKHLCQGLFFNKVAGGATVEMEIFVLLAETFQFSKFQENKAINIGK